MKQAGGETELPIIHSFHALPAKNT